MALTFQERLSSAFGNASMAEIARRINAPHATVRNYFQGRMPAPEVLIKIANETNVSLNWLLLGTGEMFAPGAVPVDIGKAIDERIELIVEKKIAETLGKRNVSNAPRRPPKTFDIAEAISRFNDPHKIMNEWFAFEGREYPRDFGVAFFRGWESYTPAEKIDAIIDAKKVLDRSLKNS